MNAPDLRGLIPAPVTPFTRDGEVDYAAIQRLGSWLGSVPGVTGLTVLGHAGEGTFLSQDEQAKVIATFKESAGLPIIAGITLEGTQVAAEEAKRAVKAGASAGLVYPSHGWLRFGYQKGAPQDRYRAIYEESGLPLILFQYPDATKATYNLETQLEIAEHARRVRDEERRAQHEALGHRDPRDPPRVPGPADLHLPRRVPAAHDVRRRWRAGRLRRHRSGAADRDDQGRQGEGLQEGARDP